MVRRIDTSISDLVLNKFVKNDHTFIPRNIQQGKFAHFSADNIDILEETLDGKNTFHATQMAVWQRGPVADDTTEMLPIGKDKTIKDPVIEEVQKIEMVQVPSKTIEPVFDDFKSESIFEQTPESTLTESRAKDIAWLISRMENHANQQVPNWSGFNRATSAVCPEITTSGFLPIIQQPAHEYDTLNTVIMRCMSISKHIQQEYTVITVDQALYCKLKELVWLKRDAFKTVVIRLGGLHVLMNYLQCIGKHMESSGLDDALIESGLYGENTVQSLLSGKAYNRAVRAHKLTYEALWRLYWSVVLNWMSQNKRTTHEDILSMVTCVSEAFAAKDRDAEINTVSRLCVAVQSMTEFVEYDGLNATNPTFVFWRQYMRMVEILLDFLRAERDGNWELHLSSFEAMLPFYALYDHTNYARWGPVYLIDMRLLETTAPSVYIEFKEGNFVVKRSADRFNQVSADQSLEWLNRKCKVAGGLEGITRNESARDKWSLTFNEKAHIAECTRTLLGLTDDEEVAPTRNDSLPSGIERDEHDVETLVQYYQRYKVFSTDTTELRCVTTNDIAPAETSTSLLQASMRGHSLVRQFIEERIIHKSISFYSPIHRVRSRTFASLTEVTVQRKDDKKIVNADRQLFHRLLVATDVGRKIDLTTILEHEMTSVPLSLAEFDGTLRANTKSDLADILQGMTEMTQKLPQGDLKTCLLIDGPALIQALGKPREASTFGDLADVFCRCVIGKYGCNITRIDILFDRYNEYSMKQVTRRKRAAKSRAIRRLSLVDSREVPLPQIWGNFIAVPSNKARLSDFLSRQLVEKITEIPNECELITSGGFTAETVAVCSSSRDISNLMANHEEADTRLVLHAVDAKLHGFERTIVECSDTDVMVMLVHFDHKLSKEVWMKKRKEYIPIHTIEILQPMRSNLLALYAISGCDTTSSFAVFGKKSVWKVFCKHTELLNEVAQCDLNEELNLEKFVCRLYGCECSSVNEARRIMFLQGKKHAASLPPTQDALRHHRKRVNQQLVVWTQADIAKQVVPDPVESGGWRKDETQMCLVPILISKEPITESCLELVSCGCKTNCSTANCKCYKKRLICTGACGCAIEGCNNPTE